MTTTPLRSQLYKPGDQIAETGTYRAHHVRIHCGWPKAILEANNLFPACPTCGTSIGYTLGDTSAVTSDEAADRDNPRRPLHT
jgi:hypothetical protein